MNPLIYGGDDHGEPPRPWSNTWEGWWPLLENLHSRLHRLDGAYVVRQVKEEAGRLLVHVDVSQEVRREADGLIRETCRDAAQTCEACGAPGRLRDKPTGRWVKTLCEEHAAPDEIDLWLAGMSFERAA